MELNLRNNQEQWNNDAWSSANMLLSSFIELLGEFPTDRSKGWTWDRKSHLRIYDPREDDSDPKSTHFKYLVQQVELAFNEGNQDSFLSASSDLIEFTEIVEIGGGLIHEELMRIEELFEANNPEILYEESNLDTSHNLIIACGNSLVETIRRNPEFIYKIDPRMFEELIADIFFKNGFEVELTATTRDGGKDIIAINRAMGIPTKYLIECKRYKKERKVTLDIVQRLYGVCYANRASMGLVVTTSTFTKDAVRFAGQHPWELALRDHRHLFNWIESIPNNSFNSDWVRRYAPHAAG